MQSPARISFKNMFHSVALEGLIRRKIEKLDLFYDRIVSCHVAVELPNRRHRQGNIYTIRIFIGVPNDQIVVDRAESRNHAHENPYIAVRDAFDIAYRQLEDYIRRQPQYARRYHAAPKHGRILRMFDDAGGYGFLGTEDGREIYFHRNSLINGKWDALQPGVYVRYSEEDGDEGPQASTVEVVQSAKAIAS